MTTQEFHNTALAKWEEDIDGKAFELWYNHEVRLEPNFEELEAYMIEEFC